MAWTRRRWWMVASVLAGGLVLAALVFWTPWRLLAARAATVPPAGWAAAALGMSATYALRAGRLRAEWHWRLAPLGLGYRECLRVTLMHNAAVNLLPMRSGEASYAFLLHRRWGVTLGDAAASLLWLRLQDAMVLGVLGLAVLVPAPLVWRLAGAAGAVAVAATGVPALVRRVHLQARWRRGRAARARPVWHAVARIAGAFRAARGGRAAWAFAVSNWGLKLGIVAALIASLTGLDAGRALAGALGGELAAVLPVQAPAGVGTYEAGVALGARAPAGRPRAIPVNGPAATGDNRGLIVGAALTVHALMVAVALLTALISPLLVRRAAAPESSPCPQVPSSPARRRT